LSYLFPFIFDLTSLLIKHILTDVNTNKWKNMESKDINITLPVKLIKQLDKYCPTIFKKKSEYIRDLIIADLHKDDTPSNN